MCICIQLRREKIDLENTLEQEQEMLVNKLWKRMDKVQIAAWNEDTSFNNIGDISAILGVSLK